MPTKTQFFQKAVEAPGTCALTCVINRCPCTVPICDWLNGLLESYQNAEVLDFSFQIDPEPGKHCIYVIAQVRYKV